MWYLSRRPLVYSTWNFAPDTYVSIISFLTDENTSDKASTKQTSYIEWVIELSFNHDETICLWQQYWAMFYMLKLPTCIQRLEILRWYLSSSWIDKSHETEPEKDIWHSLYWGIWKEGPSGSSSHWSFVFTTFPQWWRIHLHSSSHRWNLWFWLAVFFQWDAIFLSL